MWSPKQKLKELRSWLKKSKQHIIARQQLESAISLHQQRSRGATDTLFQISSELWPIGHWACHKGAVGVLENEKEGWKSLELGLRAYCWHIRTEYELLVRRKLKMGADRKIAVLCLLHSIATGQVEWTEWFGRAILHDFEKKRLPFSQAPSMAIGGLAIRLYALLKNLTVNWSQKKGYRTGPYKDLWKNWEEPVLLASTLEECCGFHCRQGEFIEDEDAYEGPFIEEFAVVPFTVYPVEIMAIRHVRDTLHLQTPPISHPLMNTPFAMPPRQMEFDEDDLVLEAFGILKSSLAHLPAID